MGTCKVCREFVACGACRMVLSAWRVALLQDSKLCNPRVSLFGFIREELLLKNKDYGNTDEN